MTRKLLVTHTELFTILIIYISYIRYNIQEILYLLFRLHIYCFHSAYYILLLFFLLIIFVILCHNSYLINERNNSLVYTA